QNVTLSAIGIRVSAYGTERIVPRSVGVIIFRLKVMRHPGAGASRWRGHDGAARSRASTKRLGCAIFQPSGRWHGRCISIWMRRTVMTKATRAERLLAHQQELDRWRKAPPTPTAKRMIHVCETAIKYLSEPKIVAEADND